MYTYSERENGSHECSFIIASQFGQHILQNTTQLGHHRTDQRGTLCPHDIIDLGVVLVLWKQRDQNHFWRCFFLLFFLTNTRVTSGSMKWSSMTWQSYFLKMSDIFYYNNINFIFKRPINPQKFKLPNVLQYSYLLNIGLYRTWPLAPCLCICIAAMIHSYEQPLYWTCCGPHNAHYL